MHVILAILVNCTINPHTPPPTHHFHTLTCTLLQEKGFQISAATAALLTGQSKSNADTFLEFKDIENPEEGKNRLFIICDHCKCKVMRPGYGTLTEKEVSTH